MDSMVRERTILDTLLENGAISVANLSRNLAVSEVTIRSDLKSLEEKGLLSRVHGGAVPSIHPQILERRGLHPEEKQAIARNAASLIQSGDTIMIEAGTTTAQVCRYLGGKRDIHIITNSALVFQNAKANPSIKITLCGGEFRGATESFVGSIAAETIRRFNVRYAFVGTDGFSPRQGITTYLLEGGEIITVMKEKAEKIILLADSSKFNKVGTVTIMPLSGVDGIITDVQIGSGAADAMKEDANIASIIEEQDAAGTVRFWFQRKE
jgi:DeoR family galactitol utilization operon repressor